MKETQIYRKKLKQSNIFIFIFHKRLLQSDVLTLSAKFQFVDEESGVDSYKYQVYQTMHGQRSQIQPGVLDLLQKKTSTNVTYSIYLVPMPGHITN